MLLSFINFIKVSGSNVTMINFSKQIIHCCLESRDILNENNDMNNKKKVDRQRTATKILVVISMAFIFLTVPPTVVNIFYKKARQDRVFNKTEAYAYFNAIFWTAIASMNKYIYFSCD